MRVMIAAALLCALAVPACAFPVAAGLSAPTATVEVKSKAKPVKAAKAKGGKCAPGAICPLVGSGNY